ncbi:MAG TPA: hypothetical protein VGO63_00640 [Candidatus Paceibacterota bacterium]|nr:hypothetical protein [Candidatus Paceibacterota bacterium]
MLSISYKKCSHRNVRQTKLMNISKTTGKTIITMVDPLVIQATIAK